MNTRLLGILAIGTALFGTILHAEPAYSDDAPDPAAGTRAIYGNIPNDQIEFLSSPDRIKSAVAGGSMSLIWETLRSRRGPSRSALRRASPRVSPRAPRSWSRVVCQVRRW